jgi:phosphate transport system permease protein
MSELHEVATRQRHPEGSEPEPANQNGHKPDIDFTAPLAPTGNLARREWISRVAEGGATVAALLAVAVLAIVVYTVVDRGGSAISIDFLVKDPPLFGGAGGGIAPYLVGTIVIVAVATAIAMPIGVMIAVYLSEFADRRSARLIGGALDLLNGLPSIVIAVFVFGLLVAGHAQSGFAGSFALSIIMLPLIARPTQQILLLVPSGMREAADALGVSRWRTVLTVILPSAMGGIVTATILAVARAAGETAPLLLCSSIFGNDVQLNPFGNPLPNIPVSIFQLSEQADPAGYTRAWGEALVLLSFILFASVGARAALTRSRSKLSQA